LNSGANADWRLRDETPDDQPFLLRLFASTQQQLLQSGLADAQLQGLLQLQFRAREGQYRQQCPDARWSIIEQQRSAVGRLGVQRTASQILLIDIALLPEHRRLGIGSQVLQALQAEAQQTGQTISLHADREAAPFYQRLGFVVHAEDAVHANLRWRPE
jgi:GNAT superfamily N-acetyltransferase